MYIFLDVFLLDIFCQHLWGVVHIITGFEHRTSARKTIARPHNYMFLRPDKCQGDKCQTSQIHAFKTGQVPGGQVPDLIITCY